MCWGNTYSLPNHNEMKAPVSRIKANEMVPAIKKRIPISSQNTCWIRLESPSAIRLPTPALVLPNRLLINILILSIMRV